MPTVQHGQMNLIVCRRGSPLLELRSRLIFLSAQRFFVRLPRVTSGDLFVPGGMKCPSPCFADRAARHRLKRSWLADGTEVDVDEDSTQHDDCGDVVHNIADGYGPASKGSRPGPENDSGNQVDDAADDNLPKHYLLAGVEEAGVG